jgi:hypothetical protein
MSWVYVGRKANTYVQNKSAVLDDWVTNWKLELRSMRMFKRRTMSLRRG